MASPLDDDYALCLDLLRQDWRDMYLADLLLPDAIRPLAVAVHAFHNEITKAIAQVNEPMAGEVRLQWWRDVLGGERAGEADGNPLARFLMAQLATFKLDTSPLVAKCDAHIFDLYSDPMADRTMLEGYCGETRSVLFQMLAMGMGAAPKQVSDASGHAGVAQGIVAIIYNLRASRDAGRVFVPTDLLAACGLEVADYLAASPHDIISVLDGMMDLASDHLAKAQAAIASLPVDYHPVYKPVSLTVLYLKRARNQGVEMLINPRPPHPLRRQWALWRA